MMASHYWGNECVFSTTVAPQKSHFGPDFKPHSLVFSACGLLKGYEK